jgi:hypothetical protein
MIQEFHRRYPKNQAQRMLKSNTSGPILAPYLSFGMVQVQMQRHCIQAGC